jgi:integrase/recombinase XerD
VSFPSCDFGDEAGLCGDSPVEALAAQDADFDLHHVQAAGILEAKKSPLFRSARGRTGEPTENAMSRVHVWQMIQRRARDAGLNGDICCHTFRATGITAYLDNGGILENAQLMAGHESPRTTKLYDRTGDEITLDEVERIAI